ncbi:MFS transporter [Micrococcoides hystricis]|uniref:MFS transporter n=1 Tax=Micrococcoides hystricis TaxID=1572761 RepID=A0ABV6P883_9MICC
MSVATDAEHQTYKRRAVISASLGWGLDGFTWTMYGFALTAALPVLNMTNADAGWVTALSVAASALGGVIFGNLADRYGRVRVLTWVIIGYSVFTGLTATAQDMFQFMMWRILEGMTFGGEWAVGAALVAEYSTPKYRGRLLAFIQSTYAIGWAASTAAYLVVFSLLEPEIAWRILFVIGILPAFFAIWIRRNAKDAVTLAENPKQQESFRNRWSKLFTGAQAKRTIFATVLGVGVQGVYYSVFVFLPTYLRDERGLSIVGTASYTWVAIVGSFIGYVSSGFFLDWWGRRRTFLFFFIGSAASVSLFVLTPVAQNALDVLIILVLGFFASGQAGGTGAYLSELFPTAIRGTGQAFSYNFGRALAAFGPLTVGLMAESIGLGSAIMTIAIIGAVIGITALVFLPETKDSVIVDSSEEEKSVTTP